MASSNIIVAKVAITGMRPLIWHAFGPDALPLEKQERNGVAGNDPTEWRRTVLVTKEGQLYVRSTYLFACIRDGSRNIKKGRGSIQPAVASTLQVVDDAVLIDRWMPEGSDPPMGAIEELVYIDVCGVRNPSTKARNVRYRVAASKGWHATFSIMWDKTIVSRGELESAVIDAGRLCGLGDGRSVGYGRFEVDSFTVSGE